MTRRARTAIRLFAALGMMVLLTAIPVVAPTAAKAATDSIVVRLYNSSSQLVETVTLSLSQIKDLPVQGNGSTHYYHQGPSFDEDNLWDPHEEVNLKDMGALRGADVKDICEELSAAVPSDALIQIKASDGYSKTFDYDDIYNPEAAQGKLVICYEKDGAEPPTWAEGMRLVFFADDCVFGNYNQYVTLDSGERHFYFDGSTYWPSTHGLSVKYVNQINIYDQ